MPAHDGDRPTPAPRPTNPPDGPPKTFSDLSPADQLRAVEIFRPGFQRALARHRERKRAEAAGLARAA